MPSIFQTHSAQRASHLSFLPSLEWLQVAAPVQVRVMRLLLQLTQHLVALKSGQYSFETVAAGLHNLHTVQDTHTEHGMEAVLLHTTC